MELEILYTIQRMHNTFLDLLMPAVSFLANGGMIWVIIAVGMMLSRKTRKCGFLVLVCMLICLLAGNMGLKNIVARQRPCWIDSSVQLLIPVPRDYSFPSGHTMHSFTAAVMIFFHYKKWGIMTLVLAAVIAFSRMYLFVHFPTDILGGLVIGVFVAVSVKWLDMYIDKKKFGLNNFDEQ